MEGKLAQLRSLGQKEKAQGYSSLLSQALSQSSSSARDVRTVIEDALTQDSVGLVVGRQILAELVKSLGEGVVQNREVQKQILRDTLEVAQPRLVSYEEQVCFRLPFVFVAHDRAYHASPLGQHPKISISRFTGERRGVD